MGLPKGSNCGVLPLICVILMILVSLVTGEIKWSPTPPKDIVLPEDTHIGTVIANLTLVDGDGLRITSESSYVTVNETNQGPRSLQVDIILNYHLDYEHGGLRILACNFKGEDNAGKLITWQLTLMLRDVNDETPILTHQPYTVYVPENHATNAVMYTRISADDPDMNDRMTYTLTASPQTTNQDTFKINPSTGEIILTKELNFETIRFYQYNVTVTDLVGHNISADVFITVTDVQDTPPYFTGEPFQATVPENTAVNSNVITVRAADGDRGNSNGVTLNIINETCRGLFQVNSTSGVVSLKTHADRDAGEVNSNSGVCTLVIQATEDNQYPQASADKMIASTSVTITIMDVNDNFPEFSQANYILSVDENTQQGVPINFNTPISVTDLDQGNNALFEVKVTKLGNFFEVTPSQVQSTGEILIRVKNSTILDYEKNKTLQIELEANDSYGKSTASVTVNINNINDNSPVFSNSTFHGIIPEKSHNGTKVIIIKAMDADINENNHNYGKVTYSLEGPDTIFHINDTSGLITVANENLDRETKDTYYVTVVAEDGGHSKASAVLEIKILDVNDETPKFVTNDYQASLKETEMTFMRPVTVHATDNDDPTTPNSQVRYNISSSSPLGLDSHFRMDSVTGTLTVHSPLEYEKILFPSGQEGKIILTVIAFDAGQPVQSSNVTVVVNLQDINNQIPNCNQPQYQTTVPENSSISSSILKVNASDLDGTEPNNVIMYSIDQKSAGKFLINSTSGVLSLRDKLDREENTDHDITVTVTDLGAPPKSGSCHVHVTVSDINDSPPQFLLTSQELTWTENALGLSINMSADDKDSNHKLVYKLLWQQCTALDSAGQKVKQCPSIMSNWITIDNDTGIISNKEKLDRETIGSFSLGVQVVDVASDTGPQIDNGTITVVVSDENDETPEFSSSLYEGEIQENMPDGSKVQFSQSLSVRDKDEESNSEFILKLKSYGDFFSVVPDRGTGQVQFSLTVTNSTILDYEKFQHIILEVMAIESSTVQIHNSTATVNISIINTNDNMPEFINAPFQATVLENKKAGTSVKIVKAKDNDLGIYGELTYSLEDSSGKFGINNITGEVFLLNGGLDRENVSDYSVTVIATDKGNFRATTQLSVIITDINDNIPKFSTDVYSLTINEETNTLLSTFQVQATDNDEPNTENSRIQYSLVRKLPYSDHFKVDPTTGIFNINTPLDFELLDRALNGTFTLTVLAQDQGTPQNTANATVRVTVNDVNDEIPKFVKDKYTANVPENASPGIIVFHVTAVDGDISKNNHEVSYMIDTLSGSTFSIHNTTGEITLKKKLDYETLQVYNIIVTALDHGSPVQTSTAEVHVNVQDINDEKPKFNQKQVSITEDEHKNINYSCSAKDVDLNIYLVYSILWNVSSGQDGQGASVNTNDLQKWIIIDNKTGEVKSLKLLDREQVSKFALQILVEDIRAEDNKPQTDTAMLTIIVKDVNDQIPKFTAGQFYTASVRENMPDNSDIQFDNQKTLDAYDDDEKGTNSNFNVFLLTHNTTFGIQPSFGTSRQTFTISVLNSSALDYEMTEQFNLEVLAIDPNNSNMNSSATIIVNILNENDNIPEFIGGPYKASLSEDSSLYTHVFSVNATDKDHGMYGKLTFSLEDSSKKFGINNITGEVFLLNGGLDREKVSDYSVTVIATDKGNFRATTQLSIIITDINDNPPEFSTHVYSLTINEETITLLPTFQVQAADNDEPNTENSRVKYSLVPKLPYSNHFKVDPTTGIFNISTPLDFEILDHALNGTFTLTVLAQDQGTPQKTANATVRVTVNDVNDEIPKFDKDIYTADVLEAASPGRIVFHVTAVDGDISKNNHEVSYMIDTLSGSTFSIHNTTGEITLKKKLDYETLQVYNIIVTALDHGSPVQTSTAEVHVNVHDVNDEKPSFTQKQVSITEEEHNNINYSCSAKDVDLKNDLVYSILWNGSSGQDGQGASVNTNDLQKWIIIDNKTGEVKSLKLLDREQVSKFALQILVEDMKAEENKPQNDTATLTIIVKDVNDQIPIFTAGQLYTASVRENMPDNSDIQFDNQKTLEVLDNDEKGTNSSFNVFLLTHNTTFGINPSFGTSRQTFTISVHNSSALDYEMTEQFILEVFAIDPNNSNMNSSATIIVNILNENDNIPEFIGSPYKASVPEHSLWNTHVFSVNAIDSDAGIYGQLTYSLEDSSKKFGINNVTGEVFLLNVDIDRENVSDYSMTVIATDKGNFRATTQLSVIITDINDNPPKFFTDVYSLVINEDTNTLLPTFQVQATDNDEPNTANSKIKYLLVPKLPHSAHFVVDPTTGIFSINTPFDSETLDPALKGIITLTVFAQDQGTPQHTANATVRVTVNDINDEAPYFEKDKYMVSVPENASLNYTVVTVNATDRDVSPSNSNVSYSLDPLSANTFHIDSLGHIKVVDHLDRELKSNYTIIVTAKDNGQPTLTNTTLVLVNVTDVNDAAPTFTWNSKSVTVNENSIGFIAYNFAKDPDDDPLLYYSISWPESSGMDGNDRYISGDSLQDLVAINNTTGEVYPVDELDREKVQRFELTLVVEDKHNVPGTENNDTALLKVVIKDENDNFPRFDGEHFNAIIQENMPEGSEIKMINTTALIITDADSGINSRYNITLEDSSVFTISPSEGDGSTSCVITVADSSKLDYEKNQSLTIKVIATEIGQQTQRNSSATVTIFIQNTNDNFPKFNEPLFEVHVPEDSKTGYHITTLKAHDDDLGELGKVHYYIDGSSLFVIDNDTGVVTLNTNRPLDRETKDSYTIVIKAKDKGGYEGSTQLTVTLTDVNDKTPCFLEASYAAEVKENDVAFKSPLIVKATDGDAPGTENSNISYSITWVPAEIGPNLFNIHPISGEITLLTKAPDYEKLILKIPSGIIQIVVTAADGGIPSLNSTVQVNVTVTDINDETPVFVTNALSGNVLENSPEGTFVAVVGANDNDATSPNNKVHYVILSGSRDKLQIDSQNGTISVAAGAKLDRESTEKNGFLLTVLAVDGGSPARTSSTSVSVTVLDVNDLPPIIIPTNALLRVYENVSVHSEIAEFTATDQDENCNLTFKVLWTESHANDENENEVNVSLLQNWLEIDDVNGTITVKSNMDREQVERMVLKVVVIDQNAENGLQMATATVTVSLLDVNDNPPEISTSGGILHLNVSEGTKLGTEVTTLTATDTDKGQKVIFSLADSNSNFIITDNDKLTLSKPLDREIESQLQFHVIATDNGSPPLSSNITVIINVLDINDNDPVFVGIQTVFYVPEDSDNTTWVASMTATDRDAGDNGNVTFEFKDISPFVIDPITGSIYVSDNLDRETTSSYALTVLAADNPLLESRRRASLAIIIKVEDVNDNPPVFLAKAYEGIIPETTNIGNLVPIKPAVISATDVDVGSNSNVTFSLIDPSPDYFRIHPISGEVTVKGTLRGFSGIYSYEVNATDHGNPVHWTVVNLTINVLDENINEPVFVKKGPIPDIQECASHGKSVYTFSATDDDKDKTTNGKVQYFLDTINNTGTNHSLLFDLNPDTGVLYTTTRNSNIQLFDSDTLSDLMIQVVAKDGGIPPNSVSSGLLHIKVTDINDNPPEFVPVPNTNFSVLEGQKNIKVGHVKAFDKDNSADLTYQLSDIDQPWKEYFYIMDDPKDGGVIYTNKTLDREVVSYIKMKVTAIDKSSISQGSLCDTTVSTAASRSAPLDIIVSVEDINDSPPVFQEESLSVGFLSSTKFGEKIINLQSHVTDMDTAPYTVHKFYQVGEIKPDKDISKTWTTDVKSDPIKVDINGTVSTSYKFSEDAYGYFSLQVLVNDSAGNDKLDLKVYVVGETQVVHMTLWSTEDELRNLQPKFIEELSHFGYKFVPDNILPAYKDDGSVDNSKSVLVTHAVDAEGNIVDGHLLLNKLDTTPSSQDILGRYRVFKTESGDQAGKHEEDNTDEKIRNILIGVIAVIAVTFVITLYLLLHNISRFKRKLKAATIEVQGISPMKQDTFPGLDNENIKAANPIFNRDDLILDDKYADDFDHFNEGHSDTLSNGSQNSLDQNALNSADTRERVKTTLDEQEVTLDLYGNDETEQGNSAMFFNYRHSNMLPQDMNSPKKENSKGSSDGGSDGDSDEAFNISLSNFESTDI